MPWSTAGALEKVLMTISVIALRLALALPAPKSGVLDCGDNRRDYDDMNDGFALSLRAMLLDGCHASRRLRAMNVEISRDGRLSPDIHAPSKYQL
jgi:hypothetical protein